MYDKSGHRFCFCALRARMCVYVRVRVLYKIFITTKNSPSVFFFNLSADASASELFRTETVTQRKIIFTLILNKFSYKNSLFNFLNCVCACVRQVEIRY